MSVSDAALQMCLAATARGQYADAQIDDYSQLARSAFPWRPPLRMEIRAHASHVAATPQSTIHSKDILRGTAGFGFWNYPFSVRGDILTLPEAVWFFYAAPPSNMALVPGVPGWGWKAQVVHAMRPGALFSALPTALATGWGWLSHDSRPAARWLQRLSGAQEALIDADLTTTHTYALTWHPDNVLFEVDGREILRANNPPTRALGFVAWLDNQYAIATPQGALRFGATPTEAQWLSIDHLTIEPY
ncbi:hypothetical protein [Dictyobacter arantiisoli]|uniref:GH16 domain-containing protein n=1 Tax=Dictyobacter arantiisoli TaxID=2014874 RepID=A0A5A5TDY3_9CHLR|nr:hypothetical protein [Dictyobacter arantiisoli]GCF09406.1 hypothetical protein KDI_29700 [Dictyobacter arantiisoli]